MTVTLDTLLAPVHESWHEALEPERETLSALVSFLNSEVISGRRILPAPHQVMRALELPVNSVRVLIVGQDPYPTPGHAVGLAFSVAPEVRPLPGSLRNIFNELVADVGVSKPTTGDLSPWAAQGVMLLNRVMTVPAGAPGGHRGRGWERVTEVLVRHLASNNHRFVAALWGRDAQTAQAFLGNTHVVLAAHPSPLSAHRGFLGSKPFSAINRELVARGQPALDWSLP